MSRFGATHGRGVRRNPPMRPRSRRRLAKDRKLYLYSKKSFFRESLHPGNSSRLPEARRFHLSPGNTALKRDVGRQFEANARACRHPDSIIAGEVRRTRESQRVRFDTGHAKTCCRIEAVEQRAVEVRLVTADNGRSPRGITRGEPTLLQGGRGTDQWTEIVAGGAARPAAIALTVGLDKHPDRSRPELGGVSGLVASGGEVGTVKPGKKVRPRP